MPKVEFIKKRYYKGQFREVGDIVEMSTTMTRAYLEMKAVKYYKKPPIEIDYDKMSYRQLQNQCKLKNISAVGKKEELIDLLKEKRGSNNVFDSE